MATPHRKPKKPFGPAYRFAVTVLEPVVEMLTTHEWIGIEKIPAEGGVVLVQNHVTHIDPITSAHITLAAGRASRYLAKASLFDNRLLGRFLRSAGQIPVKRDVPGGEGAFSAAVEAVRAGELVVVYPEGSVTKDPDLWPMRGKTGAARIALATGAPVIPIGQWGAHELMPAYGKPHLRGGRKHIKMMVGDPVDMSDIANDAAGAHIATERIMAAITALVEEIRGEQAPAERFDPVKAGVAATGNPHQSKKRKK